MKKFILEFIRRGLTACGFGPIVWAIIYLILHHQGLMETLTVNQVCLEIFSVSALAFMAGGMNVIYQIERLRLMVAILIHGGVLYISYLAAYLLNDWLAWGAVHILVFTGIFVVSYFIIWAIIYSVIKRDTDKVNEMLIMKQMEEELKEKDK